MTSVVPRPPAQAPGPLFVTATGTDAGKTLVSRALLARCRQLGIPCPAVKPIETGCDPHPADARALSDLHTPKPGASIAPPLYRAGPPLAPYAITLAGLAPPLDFAHLCHVTRALLPARGPALVEGAGGLLVPLTATQDIADLIAALDLPLLLVAPNRLGTLSHVFTAMECALRRDLRILAVVLNRTEATPDTSVETNTDVLLRRLDVPVIDFPYLRDTTNAADLAVAAHTSGLFTATGWHSLASAL